MGVNPFSNEWVRQRFEADVPIVSATSEAVIYEDGLILHKPLEPEVIQHEAYLDLVGYMDMAIHMYATKIQDCDDPMAATISYALELWNTDLEHKFDEWEKPRKPSKPDSRYDAAVQYAQEHKDESLVRIAERQKVPYNKLVSELKNRHFASPTVL